MGTSTARAVLILVKYPTPGAVKTRLAADIGPVAAAQLYSACAEYTLWAACRCPGAKVIIAYAPLDEHQAGHLTMEQQMRAWLEPIQSGCCYLQQISDRNLGQRMAAAMDDVLSSGTKEVILIGSDCPDIDEVVLLEAFAALQHHDVVFGPALDGGYYLVGLSQPPGKLFEGIPWSTSSVLQHSITQAHALGLSCAATLPPLQDLDTIQDLRTWIGNSSRTHPLRRDFKKLLNTCKLLATKGLTEWHSGCICFGLNML